MLSNNPDGLGAAKGFRIGCVAHTGYRELFPWK